MSDYFKTKPINIDESVSESQIKSLINFDEKLYENYKNDFLTSNSKNKNYQIILEYLNKQFFIWKFVELFVFKSYISYIFIFKKSKISKYV